jgi:hypothetical protein
LQNSKDLFVSFYSSEDENFWFFRKRKIMRKISQRIFLIFFCLFFRKLMTSIL